MRQSIETTDISGQLIIMGGQTTKVRALHDMYTSAAFTLRKGQNDCKIPAPGRRIVVHEPGYALQGLNTQAATCGLFRNMQRERVTSCRYLALLLTMQQRVKIQLRI